MGPINLGTFSQARSSILLFMYMHLKKAIKGTSALAM